LYTVNPPMTFGEKILKGGRKNGENRKEKEKVKR
jgi:hypothetical protein